MPSNKYALLRYRIINRCLRNKQKPYPTVEELRQACEEALYGGSGEKLSKSTIEKDLFTMRTESELGYFAPIAFSRGHKGYYYEDSNYSIDNLPLNEEDLEALKLAVATLKQFKEISLFEKFGYAIGKIMERVKLANEFKDNAYEKYVQFQHQPIPKGSEFLAVCLKAIENRRMLSLEYNKIKESQNKHYRLNPFVIKEYRNLWYLIANDLDTNEIKTFAFDRVVQMHISEEYAGKFDFDVKTYFENTLGITHFNNQKVEQIELRFDSSQAYYIKTSPIHHTQSILNENEEFLIIGLDLIINPELKALILSFGEKVRVLKPSKLKEEITQIHSDANYF